MQSNVTVQLNSEALRERLESMVYMVLSVRRSVEGPARELAGFERRQQERFLQAVDFISQQTVELAYNFTMFGVHGLQVLDESEWQRWVQHLLEKYSQGGVLPTIAAMQKVEEYAHTIRYSGTGVSFEEVVRVLAPFITGLNGRILTLASSEQVYTDTETLYLPARITRFQDRTANYHLYKAMAVHLWAQTWFGTWREDLLSHLSDYTDFAHAVSVFHALETLRLDACIARHLPGVYRELQDLRVRQAPHNLSVTWRHAAQELQRYNATVANSYDLLSKLYEETPPSACHYQGCLLPQITQQVIEKRKQRDKRELLQALSHSRKEHIERDITEQNEEDEQKIFMLRKRHEVDWPDGIRIQIVLREEPASPIADVQKVVDSIAQDFGSVPDEYLVAAGHGAYDASAVNENTGNATALRDENIMVYDEWDYMRKQHRREWCLLHERNIHPVDDDFVAHTRMKYRGLLKHLYRTFEALRGEDKILKKQAYGDGVDIDAVVEAYSDLHVGLEPSENLFTKRQRVERDVAVIFLIDMSGSTKGWINEIERESLVLLCESLEILGDRYAIYGFSGLTHKRCDLFRVKQLDEPYNDDVRARISGIKPQDYTRMGVFIRHAIKLFQNIDARTKLLITLSDGRPDDQDGYRGVYGIEDTRQALIEARMQGIHPYCITIDESAMEYLPHMYGAVNFAVIDQVHKLPYKVSDIYRRITM